MRIKRYCNSCLYYKGHKFCNPCIGKKKDNYLQEGDEIHKITMCDVQNKKNKCKYYRYFDIENIEL